MLDALRNVLFGCTHRKTTFPLTPNRKLGASSTGNHTYVACLDCGKEFRYNWNEMRVGELISARRKVEVDERCRL